MSFAAILQPPTPPTYGVLIRKNRACSEVETGMLLEKFPVPSNVPELLVVHVDRLDARFVVVSTWYVPFAVPPDPAKTRLPPTKRVEFTIGCDPPAAEPKIWNSA